MRITLKNFRCYIDQTFDFGKGGIVLLSGPSGQGKSSILFGIYFALYGSGSKVTSFGKTSCSVELEFDGMKIIRSKRPNRVVVDSVYEDDVAQELINKKFGDAFDVTGYVAQNAINSFILMSPIDKLSFLEKFAFKDVDVVNIKSRCKSHINKCHDELLSVVSQLDMANNFLSEMTKPNEVKFPLKCKDNVETREKDEKNEQIKMNNCTVLIRRSEKTKDLVAKELNDLKVLEATLHSRKEICEEINKSLQIIENEEKSELNQEDSILQLKDYEKRLNNIQKKRDLYILKAQLDADLISDIEMRRLEIDDLNKELDEVNEELWKEYTKGELEINICDLNNCIVDLEKIESLRKENNRYKVDPVKHEKHKEELNDKTEQLEKLQSLHDKLKMQSEIYSCPSCMVKLCMHNEKLIALNIIEQDDTHHRNITDIYQEIKTIKLNISKLHIIIPDEEHKLGQQLRNKSEIERILSTYDDISTLDGVKQDIEYLREYQSTQNGLEKKKKILISNLENEKFSPSYLTFHSHVEKLQEKVDKLEEIFNDNICDEKLTEEELRQNIFKHNQVKEELEELQKRKKKLLENRARSTNIMDESKKIYIDKYTDIKSQQDLEENIKIEHKKLIEYEDTKKMHTENIKKIQEFKKYEIELQKYQEWEIKVEDLDKKEKYTRSEYSASTQLKEKILESESIAMINIIESINTHARLYLDLFFSDNPISVHLQPFKESKKSTKPQINIEIEYKGMEADLSMLSGGELARVILAYTLALSEMFSNPILLLDECTASLDEDTTNTVFEVIKENFQGKMVIIIAHQIVQGTFDKHIDLTEK